MNDNKKKTKQKSKSNNDLTEVKGLFNPKDDIDNDISDNDSQNKRSDSTRRRKHTKITHKKKDNSTNEIMSDDQSYKGKKVKFNKIEVVDVESWKVLNLKLTAEENLDELLKLSNGKKERVKNVSCTCVII